MFSDLKSIENKSYIFSRIVSVTIKPLLLFVSLSFGYKEFGAIIAMIFLVNSTNMMIFSIPIFRNFFINKDNKSILKKKYYSNKYKFEIILVFLISVIFLIPINFFFENGFEIFFCSISIYSINKIYDEIQRLLIIKKHFYRWSIITNFKNFTLMIFLLSPILNINILYFSIIYFLINFFALYKFIKISFNFYFISRKKINRFVQYIWKNKQIYLINYFLIFYNLGDKILVGKNYKEILLEYIFLSNILTISLSCIHFFYIAKYRSEFVKNDINFREVVLGKKFNYLLISSFLITSAIIFCYLNLYPSKLSIESIIFLLLIYLIKSYNLILNEVIYWKNFYREFFFFEFIFFVLIILFFLLIVHFSLDLNIFLFWLLIFFVIKFTFKIFYFKKKITFKNFNSF
jgi:hypothetical protein